MLIDTHCHLYLPEFEGDIDSAIQRAEKEGITKFFLPAIDSETDDRLIHLESRFPSKCYAMMGLHPTSVRQDFRAELARVNNWLQKRAFSAIGEIGLDFYWDRTFEFDQMVAFRQQIEWALEFNLPIVIHSRNALDECIEIVTTHQNGSLRGIFHCFSGSLDQAKKIIDTGFYLGIGGVLTYKNSGLAAVIGEVSLDHIVLETDAPYLAPVPFRGKRNESSYLKYVTEKLATLKSVSIDEIGRLTTANAENVFSAVLSKDFRK